MIKTWEKIRKKILPKRIYRYGTMGLGIFDDRTKLEKILDKLEKLVIKYDQLVAIEKQGRKQVFHSFFDISTGQWIHSVAEIKEIEKERGLTFASFREIGEEANRYHKINRESAKIKIKKDIRSMYESVKRGRKSYVKDTEKKIAKDEYEIGQKQTFNQ